MLLERHYGVRPSYVPSPPRPSLSEIDAALVIGNEAMMHEAEPVPYTYDLGDLWLRKTGHPVVFAVFLVGANAARTMRADIERVVDSYYNSLACLETERSALIDAARAKYPDVAYDIDTYYRLLRFEFTHELKSALEYYYARAGEMGLIPKVREIRYYG
jgi:chorismate dehydratase